MIGTRIQGTLWSISWRYTDPAKQDSSPIHGRNVIITADPSGADVHEVARLVVLGAKATPEHAFVVLTVERASEVDGLALLPVNDRGWPAELTTSFELLAAAARQSPVASSASRQAHGMRTAAEVAALWAVVDLVERGGLLSSVARDILDEAKLAREERLQIEAMAGSLAGARP